MIPENSQPLNPLFRLKISCCPVSLQFNCECRKSTLRAFLRASTFFQFNPIALLLFTCWDVTTMTAYREENILKHIQPTIYTFNL